jgi:hypothetical protein
MMGGMRTRGRSGARQSGGEISAATTHYGSRGASLVALSLGVTLMACAPAAEPTGANSGGRSGTGASTASGGASTGGAGAGGIVSAGGSSGKGGALTGGASGTGTAGSMSGGTTGGAGIGGMGSGNAGAGGAPVAGNAGASGMEASGGAGMGGALAGAGGSPPNGGFPENSGADCASSAAELEMNRTLPDPFAMHDGTRISTKAQWSCRRNEIKKDIEKYEIGPKPEPPAVEATLSEDTLSVKITTTAGTMTLTSTVGMPSGDGPHCVAIGMNANASLISGCVQVPFMHDQVVQYAQDSSQSQSDNFYEVYPELWDKVGNYAAWSWGISRLIDGLEQVKEELDIDTTKIGVQGCSYAGKMALFGGAFDERVALTVVQESGGGGINSWRTSQDFTTRTGTDIEKIDNTNYGWFLNSMQGLDPYSLPHDHHELIAMIAPRPVIALGNQDFAWLGDESGWKSINAAKEVWKAMGVADRIGFDFTSNHGHCQAPTSQENSVEAFVERFLKGQSAETEIVVPPEEGNLELDFTTVIDWQTPTLQ